MHSVVVLGTDLQGQAALYDLIFSDDITQVLAVDADERTLERVARQLGREKIRFEQADAREPEQIAALLEPGMAVIHLLPPAFRAPMARVAVEAGCHFVDASYPDPGYAELHEQARSQNVAILPECGLDPGIDLLLAKRAVSELDEVVRLDSYGAGIPAPEAARNPLRYKISWSWDGVLNSYYRPARLLRAGAEFTVEPSELFAPENIHAVEVEGLGRLEAYPNGNALAYLEPLGIHETVQESGRYSLRWPGHAAFWYPLTKMGFLSEEPVTVEDATVRPRRLLRDMLAPQLQYGPDEADIALVRVEASGTKDGVARHIVYQLIDQRDPATGHLGMQRTVGFTASIAAQMLLRNEISARGFISVVRDVPAGQFFSELELRDIYVRRIK